MIGRPAAGRTDGGFRGTRPADIDALMTHFESRRLGPRSGGDIIEAVTSPRSWWRERGSLCIDGIVGCGGAPVARMEPNARP